MMITIKREGDDWAEGIDRSDDARPRGLPLLGAGDRRPDQGRRHRRHGRRDVPHARETLGSSRERRPSALIINGVECEPYLTSDHRTMLEHGEELLVGVTILMKALAGPGKPISGSRTTNPTPSRT